MDEPRVIKESKMDVSLREQRERLEVLMAEALMMPKEVFDPEKISLSIYGGMLRICCIKK